MMRLLLALLAVGHLGSRPYYDANLGFALALPAGWEVGPDPNNPGTLTRVYLPEGRMSIAVRAQAPALMAKDYENFLDATRHNYSRVLTEGPVRLAGMEGRRFIVDTGTGDLFVRLVLQGPRAVVELDGEAPAAKFGELRKAYENAFATFHWLRPGEAPTPKGTRRYEGKRFAFTYPASWLPAARMTDFVTLQYKLPGPDATIFIEDEPGPLSRPEAPHVEALRVGGEPAFHLWFDGPTRSDTYLLSHGRQVAKLRLMADPDDPHVHNDLDELLNSWEWRP